MSVRSAGATVLSAAPLIHLDSKESLVTNTTRVATGYVLWTTAVDQEFGSSQPCDDCGLQLLSGVDNHGIKCPKQRKICSHILLDILSSSPPLGIFSTTAMCGKSEKLRGGKKREINRQR